MKNQHHKKLELPCHFPKSGFISSLDKRTEVYCEIATLYNSIVEDLGGSEQLSAIQLVLVERFCFIAFTMRKIENQLAKYPKSKKAGRLFKRLVYSTNALLGLSRTLGIKKAKKRMPNIKMYAAGKRA